MLTILTVDAEKELRHLDCSQIKRHQHGVNPRGDQTAQTMDRTIGSLNTKLSAVVDARVRALELWFSAGQQHDQPAVLSEHACMLRRRIVADTGPDADSFRAELRAQRARCCIAPKRGRRHQIENFLGRIKAQRRTSTRYDKLATTFFSFVHLATAMDRLTHGF